MEAGRIHVQLAKTGDVRLSTTCIYFLANLACMIAWPFIFSWGYFDMALGFVLLALYSNVVLQGISYMALDEAISELGRLDKLGQVGVVRGLVHNGLALYDTVLLILVRFNLGHVLVYRAGVGLETSGTIVLALTVGSIVGWTIIDLVFMDKYSRYVISTYIAFPYFFLASLVGNAEWNLNGTASRNASLTLVFLIISLLMLLVKLIVMINRHRRCPDPRMRCEAEGTRNHMHANTRNDGPVASIEEVPTENVVHNAGRGRQPRAKKIKLRFNMR